MNDELYQQMVNELCHLLKSINNTYKDFFHCKLLTMVDLKEEAQDGIDETCEDCIKKHRVCYRCVVGFKQPVIDGQKEGVKPEDDGQNTKQACN